MGAEVGKDEAVTQRDDHLRNSPSSSSTLSRQMSANLVARIDRHCRSWTDVRSTPRASHWMIHARSLLNEAREHHLHAAASCLDTLCRRQEAMTHRTSGDVRLSIR